jgi:hypothetical protein
MNRMFSVAMGSLLIVAFCLPSGVSHAQQKRNLQASLKPRDDFKNGTYRNHDFGFSLRVPRKGWQGVPDPVLPNVLFFAFRDDPRGGKWKEGVSFRPNVTLGIELVPPGVEVKDYAAAAVRALDLAGWKLVGERGVTWGGQQGYEVKAIRKEDNVALVQRYAVFRGGAIVLAATARPNQMKEVGAEFSAIFETFKIAKGTGKKGKKKRKRTQKRKR